MAILRTGCLKIIGRNLAEVLIEHPLQTLWNNAVGRAAGKLAQHFIAIGLIDVVQVIEVAVGFILQRTRFAICLKQYAQGTDRTGLRVRHVRHVVTPTCARAEFERVGHLLGRCRDGQQQCCRSKQRRSNHGPPHVRERVQLPAPRIPGSDRNHNNILPACSLTRH